MVEDSRWDRAQPVLPYLFILLPAVFAVLRDWRPEALLVPLALAAWHWLLIDRRRADHPAVMIAYFVVLLAFLAVLLRIDSAFFVTGISAFVLAFTLLPGWWAYAGVAATSGVLVVVPERSGSSARELVFSFLVAVLIASAVGLTTRAITEQSEQRKVMIGRLQELAEENAELQARLLTQAREAGVLDERQRMAREIHDTIAQSLTGILTQLEADDGAGKRLETVRGLARDALTEARRSVQALRPTPLDDAQLASALREVAEKWSESSEVATSVEVTGEPRPLHVEVEVALLRVAQEALANVGKHARASRVGITLSYMEDVVALDVRDDGAGFVPARTAGFGLVAMRQRVTRLAGAFEVETAPGQGTGISATVPAIPPEGECTVIRLLIVDDHPIVRDGLQGIFAADDSFDVVGEAADGPEALVVALQTRPDVVLMDLRMPKMTGAEVIRGLREQTPGVQVLVLTTFDDDADVLPAMKEGAIGYLLKDTPRAELRNAVLAAARGETVLSPTVAGVLTAPQQQQQRLSDRELEVLTLVARGATNRDIATKLFITEATVKTHLLHVFAKLEVNDRAAAVAVAYDTGLLKPGG